MTRIEFLHLTEHEQNVFISKLLHAVRTNDYSFNNAIRIVEIAEINKMFEQVKFGSNIYQNKTT